MQDIGPILTALGIRRASLSDIVEAPEDKLLLDRRMVRLYDAYHDDPVVWKAVKQGIQYAVAYQLRTLGRLIEAYVNPETRSLVDRFRRQAGNLYAAFSAIEFKVHFRNGRLQELFPLYRSPFFDDALRRHGQDQDLQRMIVGGAAHFRSPRAYEAFIRLIETHKGRLFLAWSIFQCVVCNDVHRTDNEAFMSVLAGPEFHEVNATFPHRPDVVRNAVFAVQALGARRPEALRGFMDLLRGLGGHPEVARGATSALLRISVIRPDLLELFLSVLDKYQGRPDILGKLTGQMAAPRFGPGAHLNALLVRVRDYDVSDPGEIDDLVQESRPPGASAVKMKNIPRLYRETLVGLREKAEKGEIARLADGKIERMAFGFCLTSIFENARGTLYLSVHLKDPVGRGRFIPEPVHFFLERNPVSISFIPRSDEAGLTEKFPYVKLSENDELLDHDELGRTPRSGREAVGALLTLWGGGPDNP